jgi:L-seryl-tRNA(Ser) seleniumtransferase
VHALLADAEQAGLTKRTPRGAILETIRTILGEARRAGGWPPANGWMATLERRLAQQSRLSLAHVVNATGVILHTNLGRAPLAEVAQRAMQGAFRYSTLEFERDAGARGSRQDHTRGLLVEITGAEDALVVNNAASALLLVLNTVAEGGETVVSRGELVEIGGAFRIPEILQKSGSVLIEVGTTNRTRLRDYALAVSPRTTLFLKVHRSNFELKGFVSEVAIEQLVALGRERAIPAAHDVGSGLLLSLHQYGLRGEPRVQDSVGAGATVIFSGDKLLGGPQAGIIVGPAGVVGAAAKNSLARALRPDKTILAALEATLMLYRDPEHAMREIPTLAMLTADPENLKRRARRLARRLPQARTEPGASSVGGGSFPGAALSTTLIVLEPPSCDRFLAALRAHDPPVIARVADGKVLLDPRTIADDELPIVASAVRAAQAT